MGATRILPAWTPHAAYNRARRAKRADRATADLVLAMTVQIHQRPPNAILYQRLGHLRPIRILSGSTSLGASLSASTVPYVRHGKIRASVLIIETALSSLLAFHSSISTSLSESAAHFFAYASMLTQNYTGNLICLDKPGLDVLCQHRHLSVNQSYSWSPRQS